MHPNTFARFIRASRKVCGYGKSQSASMPLKVTHKMSRAAKAPKSTNLNKTPAAKTDNTEGVHATSVKRAGYQRRLNNKPMHIRKVTSNTGK